MTKDKSSKQSVQLGNTEIRLDELVSDPRGIEEMLAEFISKDWSENHYLSFGAKIKPFASPADLAEWNEFLLERYQPLYTSKEPVCRDCVQGPCKLEETPGQCGQELDVYQARKSLGKACDGLAAQLVISRQLLNHALKIHGAETTIDLGKNITFADAAPSIALVTGLAVHKLSDLDRALAYSEQQFSELVTSLKNKQAATGELEGQSLHAGSMLLLAMSVAEILKLCFFGFISTGNMQIEDFEDYPPASTQGGLGSVNTTKDCLVFAGDDFLPAWYVIERLKELGKQDTVEICGIGSVGCELPRFYESAKVLSGMPKINKALEVVRPAILVLSESCGLLNELKVSLGSGTKVITTARNQTLGLPDRTGQEISEIVNCLLTGEVGAAIFDPEKAAMVAAELVGQYQNNGVQSAVNIEEWQERCRACDSCQDACFEACPAGLSLRQCFAADDETALSSLARDCDFCGRCEASCPIKVPVRQIIRERETANLAQEKFRMRAGRGPVPEPEVRAQAFGLTFGNSPGMVAVLGCGGGSAENDLGYIARELASINCIVFTAGCASIEIAKSYSEKEQKFIFEQYGASALARNIVNCGGCAAQVHIIDSFSKVVRLGGAVSHYANFIEAADYAYNRVCYAAVLWGMQPDRMYTLANAYAHRGVPVIVGPYPAFDYPRFLPGNAHDRSKWQVFQGMTGARREMEPAPHHLIIPVETKEEAVAMTIKLMARPSDRRDSRFSTMEGYLGLFQRYFGELPEDWQLFVRSEQELPLRLRIKLLNMLKDKFGWEIEKNRIKQARTRDGNLVPIEDFHDHYGIEQAGYSTSLEDFIQRQKGEE